MPVSSSTSPVPSASSSSSTHPPARSPLPPLNPNPLKPQPQPSSSTLHPLLAPLGQASDSPHHHPGPPEMPEKCLTFCSQRHDGPPLCRMLCLRRRSPQPTQAEKIARLRPQRRAVPTTEEAIPSLSMSTLSLPSWSPFESLRRRLEPYSLVYVRGTPDGVVGRYMEEMEYDDGQYDFGGISRGAGHLLRRKSEGAGMEFLDWGDHGSLMHLPLTSLFHPILSIPHTVNRILSPTQNFLTKYRDSFTDEAQIRALHKFREEVDSGGAVKVMEKIERHWVRFAKQKELIEKQREVEKAEVKEVKGKVGEEKSLRTALEQQVRERKAQSERGREENEGVKKVGKEVEGKGA